LICEEMAFWVWDAVMLVMSWCQIMMGAETDGHPSAL
jgi:hypothetical protein